MEMMAGWSIWAQTAPDPSNPGAVALLALRRWCGSLTLSSPRSAPGSHGVWVLLAGWGMLLLFVLMAQGPGRALRQLFDVPGHLKLIGEGIGRLRRSAGAVAILIGLAVLSWTGAQALLFWRESGRADLLALLRTRSLGELAVEQGVLAAVTPLRDVAGLADNMPLLIVAVIALFRASIEPQDDEEPGPATGRSFGGPRPGWTTLAWGTGFVYILYRIVARLAASPELPFGNCLVIETILIPLGMAFVDGFLLAWLLATLRNAGLDDTDEVRFAPAQAIALMPAASIACLAALPARYVAAFVLLANDHLPTSVHSTEIGNYIRWQLGDWGLADVQAAAMLTVGMAGTIAWTRGRSIDALRGYGRLLADEGGHLLAALMLAGMACGVLSGVAYAVVLLLPPQSWVLNAADSYAHYATLPIGLWTLAAMIELGRRSLPIARRAQEIPRHVPDDEEHAEMSDPESSDPMSSFAAPST